jgi:hypothetical protein
VPQAVEKLPLQRLHLLRCGKQVLRHLHAEQQAHRLLGSRQQGAEPHHRWCIRWQTCCIGWLDICLRCRGVLPRRSVGGGCGPRPSSTTCCLLPRACGCAAAYRLALRCNAGLNLAVLCGALEAVSQGGRCLGHCAGGL